MYKVVVISSFHEQGLALLRRDDIELHVVDDFSHESLSRALKDADAVTVRTIPLTPELLDFAPRLRIVSRFGVGTDNIPVDYLSNRGSRGHRRGFQRHHRGRAHAHDAACASEASL